MPDLLSRTNTGLKYVTAGYTTPNADAYAPNTATIEGWFGAGPALKEANGGTGATSLANVNAAAAIGLTAAAGSNITLTTSGAGVISLVGDVQPGSPVQFPAGSAALPSLTKAGDLNTGIYFPAVDSIGMGTAGIAALVIDSSGNVDIDRTGAILLLQSTRALSIKGTSNAFLLGGNETLTGTNNIAIGTDAGIAITTGSSNVMIGSAAGQLLADGIRDTFIGRNAGKSVTSGSDNTMLGYNAGNSLTTADFNTLIGRSAGGSLTTGDSNTSLGYAALDICLTGTGNVAVGDNSLGLHTGSFSVAIGSSALSSSTGDSNVAVGRRAGFNVSTGTLNTLLGYQAGDTLTTGSSNIVIGASVDAASATGSNQLNIGNILVGDLSTGQLQIVDELQVGTATGGFKGAGTANFAGDIYKNNTAYTSPDFVFEYAATGKIERYKQNEGAATYAGPLPLEDLESYVLEHHHFPLISREPSGMFARGDMLLGITEELFLYIAELHHRLQAVEQHH